MSEIASQADFIAKAEALGGDGPPVRPDVAAAQEAHKNAHRPPHPQKPPEATPAELNEQVYSD